MRTSKEIYEDTKKKLMEDNCQSLNVMALEAIDEAKRELYREMYDLALNKNEESVILFLDEHEEDFKLN